MVQRFEHLGFQFGRFEFLCGRSAWGEFNLFGSVGEDDRFAVERVNHELIELWSSFGDRNDFYGRKLRRKGGADKGV